MRNLKRVLSLGLASVMLMGMMVVGAGAASSDFTDADEIKNVEAVDVMVALGILEGGDKGDFQPNSILTREQAAKIICYMLLGPEAAEKLATSGTVFNDVAANRWSAPFIGYCVNLGILAGDGNGNFFPEGKLTGAAFAKMLLVALGYDPKIEEYVGNNWTVSVAADAIEAGIAPKGVVLTNELSRQDAAQMAFQTLTATLVAYEGGTNITTGDTSIVVDAKRYNVGLSTEASGAGYDLDNATAYTQFCEKYFSELKKKASVGTSDDYARPAAYAWFIDKDESGSYTSGKDTIAANVLEKADYTAVITKDTAKAAATNDTTLAANINDILGITKNSDKLTTDVTGNNTAMQVNGAAEVAIGSTNFNIGDSVEFYVNDNNLVTNIVVVRESAAKIVDVKPNTGKATVTVDGEKVVYDYNIYVDYDLNGTHDKIYTDVTLPGYTDKYVKGSYLAVTLNGTNVVDSAIANTETGAITAFNAGKTVTMGGTQYNMANATIPGYNTSVDFKTGEYALVLGSNGQLLAVDTIAAASATLTDVVYTNGQTWFETDTKYGKTTYTYYVQVVALDGTVTNVAVGGYEKQSDGVTYNNNYGIVTTAAATPTVSTISEGLYMISDVDATDTLPAYKNLGGSCTVTDHTFGTVSNTGVGGVTFKATDKKLGSDYLTSDTTYLQIKGSAATTKTSVTTGGLNYQTTQNSEKIFTVLKTVGSNQEVAAVIIAGSTMTSANSDMLFVESATTTVTANGYAQVAYDMTGKKMDITVKSADKNVTGFVTYTVDEDGVYDLTATSDAIGATADWNETVAYETGLTFVESYYGDHIGLKNGSYTLSDIPAADMVIVDLRNTDAEKNGYDATITTIADMSAAMDTFYNGGTTHYYAVQGSVYVNDAGAVVFFVTGTVQGASV